MNKAIAVFFAVQIAIVVSAPATEYEGENANMQQLLHALVSKPTQTTSSEAAAVKSFLNSPAIIDLVKKIMNDNQQVVKKPDTELPIGNSQLFGGESISKVPVSTVVTDWSNVPQTAHKYDEATTQEQAKNAKYQFASEIDDGINGNYQQRAEIRQNGVVYGKYSYDDGFNWRTVYYEADSNGFRVTKNEVLPSHMTTHTGKASVQSLINGNLVDYNISEKDIHSTEQSAKTIIH